MSTLGHLLITFGALLLVVGVVLIIAGKVPGLGRLSGHVAIQKGSGALGAPAVKMIILSLVLTLLLNLRLRIFR